MGRFAGGEFRRDCPRDRVPKASLHNHDPRQATNLYRPSQAPASRCAHQTVTSNAALNRVALGR